MTTYAVTGATGHLGSLAVASLLAAGVPAGDVVAVVRDAGRASALADRGVVVRVADYTDPASLTAALADVDRLLLVSSSAVGERVAQHANVIRAATEAGVGLVAYTSLLHADTSTLGLAAEHIATEKLLAESGLRYVLLRNGWYWENFIASAPAAIDSGVLYGAGGDGRIAGAARADYAAAAAAALVTDDPRQVYELAGSYPLDYIGIAAVLADVSGKPVRYQDLPEADYAGALEQAGLPQPVAAMLADSDAGAAQGGLDGASTDLEDLIGGPSASFADVAHSGLTVSA